MGTTTRKKKIDLATGCGGLSAFICTLSMLFPIIVGTAGASVSGAMARMSGTVGAAQSSVSIVILNALRSVSQPLLIASILLILYGMRHFGKLPLSLSGAGGVLLYLSMFALNMSIPLIAASSTILAVGYGLAYGPFITRFVRS